MQSTLERELTTATAPAVAAPLTEAEQDALVALSASTEKVARVSGSIGTSTSRGWSLAGNVD